MLILRSINPSSIICCNLPCSYDGFLLFLPTNQKYIYPGQKFRQSFLPFCTIFVNDSNRFHGHSWRGIQQIFFYHNGIKTLSQSSNISRSAVFFNCFVFFPPGATTELGWHYLFATLQFADILYWFLKKFNRRSEHKSLPVYLGNILLPDYMLLLLSLQIPSSCWQIYFWWFSTVTAFTYFTSPAGLYLN